MVAESSGVVSDQAERSSELFGGERIDYRYGPAGRLLAAATPWTTIELVCDLAGRVIKETVDGHSVLGAFNLAGDLTEVTSPAGVDTVLAYDARGTIESISVAGQRCDITSDSAGRPTRYQYGSTAIDSAYDPAGRLTRRTVVTGIRDLSVLDLSGRRAAEQLLAAGDYAYGSTGALASVFGPADPAVIALGAPARYATDMLGRLVTRSTESATETVSFDAAENPTTTTDAARSDSEPSAATRWHYEGVRLLDDGRARYHYDPAGRLTQVSTRCPGGDHEIWYYRWDAWDRLRTVTTPDLQTYHYTYDPAGRRIAKQGPDTRTRFAWFGSRLIEQATSSTGGATAEVTTWSYLPGRRTPQTQTHAVVAAGAGSSVDDGPAPTLRAGELNLGANRRSPALHHDEVSRRLYAIVCDHIDTPVALLDAATGEIAGHVTSSTIWGLARWTGIDTPWRYPGRYHDPETGLHYNVNRFYQPATGRSLNPAALGSAAVIKTDR